MNFRIGFRQTLLAQKEISVAPGHFRRDRVIFLRRAKIFFRLGVVGIHLQCARQIQFVIGRMGIEFHCTPVKSNRQRDVGMFEIELTVAS